MVAMGPETCSEVPASMKTPAPMTPLKPIAFPVISGRIWIRGAKDLRICDTVLRHAFNV